MQCGLAGHQWQVVWALPQQRAPRGVQQAKTLGAKGCSCARGPPKGDPTKDLHARAAVLCQLVANWLGTSDAAHTAGLLSW